MTITRSGANQAYSENWAKAFGGKRSQSVALAKPHKKGSSKKKRAKAKSFKS